MFNLALFGIRGQGGPGWDDEHGCCYQAVKPDGTVCRCAVGWAASPNEELSKQLARTSGNIYALAHGEDPVLPKLRAMYPAIGKFEGDFIAFAMDLQAAHDDYAHLASDGLDRGYMPAFNNCMRDFAKDYCLDYTEPTS